MPFSRPRPALRAAQRPCTGLVAFALIATVLAGCDTGTGPEPVGTLEVQSLPEVARVGETIDVTLRALDGVGAPLPGAALRLSVQSGRVEPAAVTTDGTGVARVRWTLGPSAQEQRLGVDATGATLEIPLRPQPGPPARLRVADGDGQSGPVVSTLPLPLEVAVEDAFGNPVSDVAVRFSALDDGAAPEADSARSDAAGRARTGVATRARLGTSQIRAASHGLESVAFALTVTAGPPTQWTVVSGDAQTGTVGTSLPSPVVIALADAFGNPVAGQAVTFSSPDGGTGGPAGAITDAAGRTTTTWTLGPSAGLQRLQVAAGTLTLGSITATARPGAPAVATAAGGSGQVGASGTALAAPLAVEVRDAFGNAVPDVAVSFTAAPGHGSFDPATPRTDGSGRATTRWTLGAGLGAQNASASVPGLAGVSFAAEARSGPPAALQLIQGGTQSGIAGTPLAVAPTVRVTDASGNPVPGVAVTFTVTVGGGSVSTPVAATGTDGTASAGPWTLGPAAGSQRVRASVTGIPTLDVDALAEPGPAAQLVVHAGDGQSSTVATAVPVRPAVRVLDALGNAVAGVTVTFTVTGGGGSVAGASPVSDAAGVAAVGSWTLGGSAGAQTLQAAAPGLAPVSFAGTAVAALPPPSGGFDLDLQVVGSPGASVQAALNAAVARWESAITGDLPDVSVNVAAGACGVGHSALSGVVDDVVLFVEILAIDGVGGTLGSAGPCGVRGGGGLTALGVIRLDEADVNTLVGNGHLTDVLIHEIGHVLGLGTFWVSRGHVSGAGGADPVYTSAQAVAAYQALGGSYPGGVPVENTGGAGTRDAHWRESILGTELMTGWVNYGQTNPLSRISIAALGDLGYTVNLNAADGFAATAPAAVSGSSSGRLELVEQPLPAPFVLPH